LLHVVHGNYHVCYCWRIGDASVRKTYWVESEHFGRMYWALAIIEL
jgi:hypothetical protein